MTEPYRLTATGALARLAEGSLTARALVQSCLARIAARDGDLRAWLAISDGALQQADRLDALPAERRGLLHGLPVGVKDVFDTADLPTTHNSPLYQGFRPAADAPSVDILRAHGAIVLGKTDTTEFAAAGRNTATGNPHDLSRTSGGSSAGSAAAVADCHVPLALTTQTGGSTIRPASFCGIYGYKPTAGLVSREGVKLYAISFDTVGWYGRCVDDIALLATAYGIVEPLTPLPAPGARLSVAMTFGPHADELEPESVAAMGIAADRLRAAGHSVETIDLPSEFGQLDLWHRTILHREGAQAFRNLALRHGAALHDDFHHRVENRDGRSLADLRAAYDGAARAQIDFDAIAAGYDLVIAPSAPGIAPVGRAPGNPLFNALWTLLRVPCLNLPVAGAGGGMPVGVTALAQRHDDVALIARAAILAPVLAAEGETAAAGTPA
jgi:Asp-tRNA(Asn)/Glu-tRNA(Gln) amidotransferase A subunit family amidase